MAHCAHNQLPSIDEINCFIWRRQREKREEKRREKRKFFFLYYTSNEAKQKQTNQTHQFFKLIGFVGLCCCASSRLAGRCSINKLIPQQSINQFNQRQIQLSLLIDFLNCWSGIELLTPPSAWNETIQSNEEKCWFVEVLNKKSIITVNRLHRN